MALDEATTALLAQLAGSGTRPLHEMTPAEAREPPRPRTKRQTSRPMTPPSPSRTSTR